MDALSSNIKISCRESNGRLDFDPHTRRIINRTDRTLHIEEIQETLPGAMTAGRVILSDARMGKVFRSFDLEHTAFSLTCEGFLCVRTAAGRYRLIGIASWRTFLCQISWTKGTITITGFGDGKELAPGESGQWESVFDQSGPSWSELFAVYGDAAAATRLRPFAPARWTGWGTWDYYGPEISSDKILANQQELRGLIPGSPLVQIDDGYSAWGDWLETDEERFPGGLAALAEEIRARGGIPGLWLAPFVAAGDSRLHREHPDWFLPEICMDLPGKIHLLDYSQDAVCRWLEHVLTEIRDTTGITYYKLDFLLCGITPHAGKQAVMTPLERFHRCFHIIRRVLPDAYLLGCSAPFGPTLAYTDGLRTGPDISPNSEALSRSAAGNITGFHLHGKAINADGDYLLMRSGAEEDRERTPKAVKNATWSDPAARQWRTFLAVFGASLIASDKLMLLAAEKKMELARLFAGPGCRRVVPLDLWLNPKQGAPRVLLSESAAGDVRLALFAWREGLDLTLEDALAGPATFHLEPEECRIIPYPKERSFEELLRQLSVVMDAPPITFTDNLGSAYPDHDFSPIPVGDAARHSLYFDRQAGRGIQHGRLKPALEQERFLGVPFQLREQAIELSFDRQDSGIVPVGKRFQRLYFLHNCCIPRKGELHDIRLHFADGSILRRTVIVGRETGNGELFYSRPWVSETARIAWHDPVSDAALYLFELLLPENSGSLESIEFTPLRQWGSAVILGITGAVR